MVIATKSLKKELSTLQWRILGLFCDLTQANVVLKKYKEYYSCFLMRLPKDIESKLHYSDLTDEKFNEILENANDYKLLLERDITVTPIKPPVFLDNWPEKKFCSPQHDPGESSFEMNCSEVSHSGTLEKVLTKLLDDINCLFDGWHLASCKDCAKRYGFQPYHAVWRDEWEEKQILEELELEQEMDEEE